MILDQAVHLVREVLDRTAVRQELIPHAFDLAIVVTSLVEQPSAAAKRLEVVREPTRVIVARDALRGVAFFVSLSFAARRPRSRRQELLRLRRARLRALGAVLQRLRAAVGVQLGAPKSLGELSDGGVAISCRRR